jgi:hypothetical protein
VFYDLDSKQTVPITIYSKGQAMVRDGRFRVTASGSEICQKFVDGVSQAGIMGFT